MKLLIYIVYFAMIYFTTSKAQRTFLDNFVIYGRMFRRMMYNMMDQESRSSTYAKSLQSSQRVQDVINASISFPCTTDGFRSKEKPESVHTLRPGDVDVIGAIGDSLTAGYGALATNTLSLMQEFRGVSFPIGGEKTWREYVTLPNILKEFNPNLVGYSLATSSTIDKESQFNVAESGAMTSDIVYMTKVLLKRIMKDRRVNLASDWKMINIFMGSNDFCLQSCFEASSENMLVRYKENLIIVLRLLRDNLPRTFVNVISLPYVNMLKDFDNVPSSCYITQRISCPCFIGERFKSLGPALVNVIKKYKEVEEEIVNYEEFDKDNFTVVIQPFFNEPILPRTSNGNVDYTFFSVDCFHFSQKGHAVIAVALWNDIISSVGRKQKTIFSKRLKCPTAENPYLFTRRNSNTEIEK